MVSRVCLISVVDLLPVVLGQEPSWTPSVGVEWWWWCVGCDVCVGGEESHAFVLLDGEPPFGFLLWSNVCGIAHEF